jgi:hypothetical protein
MKPVEHLETREGNIRKTKVMSLKVIIITKVFEIFTEA